MNKLELSQSEETRICCMPAFFNQLSVGIATVFEGWPVTCGRWVFSNRSNMFIRNAQRDVALSCLLIVIAGCRMSPQAKEAKYLQRGDAFVAKKDYARAVLDFKNASIAMPKDAEPYYRMGVAYLESGDFRSGARMFQRAIALNPSHPGAQLKMAELMTVSGDKKIVEAGVTRL